MIWQRISGAILMVLVAAVATQVTAQQPQPAGAQKPSASASSPTLAPTSAPAPTPTSAPTPAPTTPEAKAHDILMRMAHLLGDAQKFSVTVNSDYDAVQKAGEKISFNESRKLILNRPDQLHVDTVRSDGTTRSVVFTGKEIVLVDPAKKVYATEPQQGNVDDSIVHFVSDLEMRLPLAAMLLSKLPEEFETRIKETEYVEKASLLGVPAHHIFARTDSVDAQLWISDSDKPLPLRVILTYRKEKGQPQFRAQFADWNFSPVVAATTFTPQIPAGAQKIAFAVPLLQAAQARAAETKPKTSAKKEAKS